MKRRLRAMARLLGLEASEPVVAWNGPTRSVDRPSWWRALEGDVVLVRLDVLPGWHVLTAVQELVSFHADRQDLGWPEARADLASWIDEIPLTVAWEGLLGQLLAAAEDPVFAEILFADVQPAELQRLVAEARDVGLSYLCDVRLATESPALLPRTGRAWIHDEVRISGDRVRGQQIADYVRNQHTRAAIFVRGEDRELRFVPEALRAVEVGPVEDHPLAWSLEPPPVPMATLLAEPDTPPGTAEVEERARGWVAGADVVEACGEAAVLAALELGLVQIRE